MKKVKSLQAKIINKTMIFFGKDEVDYNDEDSNESI